MHPLVRGERREVGAPRLALPGRDVGLGAVVDHERELRERGGDPRGRRQVLGEQQQVVGQAGLRDGAQPARDVVALEPARVGLVVDGVADAHQALSARSLPQGGEPLAGVGRGEVDPADHAGHEPAGRGGEREQLDRLLLGRRRLDGDGRADAERLDGRAQVVEADRAPQAAASPVIHG